jgi:hypothetical protein
VLGPKYQNVIDSLSKCPPKFINWDVLEANQVLNVRYYGTIHVRSQENSTGEIRRSTAVAR